ncbi:MAG TPA: PilZ domain-containing protein [Deltaproteobacteria bacterium]|nr:PilZ domain-containing protein [Deltaproteobacteria bacterium]
MSTTPASPTETSANETGSGADRPGILLVDDGELDAVARVLESQGLAFERLRGGRIPAEVAPPRDLLIVTPRRVERVRRGSPEDARPGRPLRIIAVTEDSPALRRRLRRNGLHLLVRLPADPEIWRLLVARALYEGDERREDARIAVGSPVSVTPDRRGRKTPAPASTATLVDISNRGCRLRTREAFSEGDAIVFSLSAGCLDASEDGPDDGSLTLHGRVRRIAIETDPADADEPPLRTLAVLFDPDMSRKNRNRLTSIINRWAAGPVALGPATDPVAPAIPPCQLPSLPDLTLDDETDPPVPARTRTEVRIGDMPEGSRKERRSEPRGHFESAILAHGEKGPTVLIGRDLSARGMRIERVGAFRQGDRFRLALHGPGVGEPFIVHAEIIRDDGPEGFALLFDRLDRPTADALEKLVACLPDVESLEDGEIKGMGAVLFEIMSESD